MQSITKVFSDIVKPYIDAGDENLQNQLNMNGAVNMLPNNATSQVINGVTFTVNDDGTVNVSGTATAKANLTIGSFNVKAGEAYTISDGIGTLEFDNVAGVMYATSVPAQEEASWYWRTDNVGAVIDRQTAIANYDAVVTVTIRIPSGVTVNYIFKPMFTLASYNGEYVSYAKSNKELTEDVAVKLGGTPTANTTYIDTSDLHYEQFGKVTHVFGNFSTKTAIESSDALVQLFTDLPKSNGGMGGTGSIYTLCLLHDNTNDGLAYRCFVSTDGALVSRHKAIPVGMYFADFTYISA